MSDVGYIQDVPGMADKSDAEQIAFVREVVERGIPPSMPTRQVPSRSNGSAVSTVPFPAGIFNPDEELDGTESYRSEPYTMPTGSQVWVHPISPAEAMYISQQVLREIRREGLLRDGLSAEEAKVQGQNQAVQMQVRGQVWQTICCARRGPEPDALPVFEARHADKMLKRPGMNIAVSEITALSDQLAQGKSEAEALREGLVRFFERMGSWLETLLSQWPSEELTSCRESLEDFAASVSTLRQQGKWSADELTVLGVVMGVEA